MTLGEFIEKALRVRFKDKGRDYSAWDCYSVVLLAYREILNIELPSFVDDYVDAGDTPASRRVIHDIILRQKQNWTRIDDPQALDVVLFQFGDAQTHLGLMVDKKRFLHCEKKINTVIERLDSAKWAKRVEGVYRLKAVGCSSKEGF
ncbi:MAG: NlpC/P60 family protein, partial [Candidatus Omnitrophica bacterium]|nr:NlpC/P60 family protein [Candidatus Omnitrophota bacterium]